MHSSLKLSKTPLSFLVLTLSLNELLPSRDRTFSLVNPHYKIALTMAPIIYIVYNAKASVVGKLTYVYRKVTASKDESVCAACDLTHGGINLTDTEEWKETKAKIGADVKQLHLDELTDEVQSKTHLTIAFILLTRVCIRS